jgi:hypothetical protein
MAHLGYDSTAASSCAFLAVATALRGDGLPTAFSPLRWLGTAVLGKCQRLACMWIACMRDNCCVLLLVHR